MFGKLRLQSEGRGTLPLNISAITRYREDLPSQNFFLGGLEDPSNEAVNSKGRRQSSPCAESPELEV